MRRSSLLTSVLFLIVLFLSILSHSTGFAQEFQWETVEQSRSDSYQTLDQILKNLPEWDGIYVVTKTGYIEISTKKAWTRVRFSKGFLLGPHVKFDKKDGETTHVPVSEFVGFLIKGRDYMEGLSFRPAQLVKGSIPVITWDEYWIFINKMDGTLDKIPSEKMRRKTVAPETYLIVFEDPVKLFGTVEKGKFIAIDVTLKNNESKVWFVGLQESGSSSFGGIQK